MNISSGEYQGALGMANKVYDAFVLLMQAGGFVMIPLLMVGILIWTLLGVRFFNWVEAKRINETYLRTLIQRVSGWEVANRWLHQKLNAYDRLIDTLVAAAPLLGLLGTVSGMIVTFEGLTTMRFFSQQGGIAGGISEALLTTQAGLVVAIPAFFFSRILNRKVDRQLQRFRLMATSLSPEKESTR